LSAVEAFFLAERLVLQSFSAFLPLLPREGYLETRTTTRPDNLAFFEA
jgi:hypothetical protein